MKLIHWLIVVFVVITPIIAESATLPIYRIGPSDVLNIIVFDNPEFSGDFTVTQDGFVVYPLIGAIPAAGLTVDELRNAITARLEKDYLYHPVVSVLVKTYKSQSVSIFGNYGSPGTYYISRPLRLFDLLTQANAISPQLGKIRRGQHITISRRNGDFESRRNLAIDAWQLIVEGDDQANILLQDGDLVYLPQISQIQVISGVRKPGIYVYEENMTVLKAITLAGGLLTQHAALRDAVIRRVEDGKVVRQSVSMDELLQPDDILEVPSEKLEIYMLGEVNRPGALPFEEGLTVLMAITRAGGATKKASLRNITVKRIENQQEVKLQVQMGDLLKPGDIIEVPLSFW